MAQLKDLIVNGATRLIGDAFANKVTISTLADSAGNIGTDGQVLKSDGENIVWSTDNKANITTTANSVAYYSDTTGTFASDADFLWDATNNKLTAAKLNGYVMAGQKSGTTLGTKATAEGNDTTASGVNAHAEGDTTTASSASSHAEGYQTIASGNSASKGNHAEGYQTTASGQSGAHAEGYLTTASGNFGAHAEGYQTTANGQNCSHAEGYHTTASGLGSHAEGQTTTASGTYSHTEGGYSTASGIYTHAEGYATTAQRRSQHVFGEANILDTEGASGSKKGTYIEIVGNGTASDSNGVLTVTTRSNARTLDWDGNESLAGNLLPMVTNSKTLGDSNHTWADAYITTIHGALSGNAATATKLKTAQSLTTKLDSTTAVTFDGSAGQDAIPVTGTLPVAHGGTAVTTVNDIFATYGVEYIVGTQTAKTGSWTGVTNSAALYVGKTIAYKLPFAGSGNATLNLTLANGTTTGAKAVYAGNTRLTTQYPANSIMIMTWNGTDWRTNPYYDTDTYSSAQCGTAAGTAAKVANCAYWVAKNKSYIHVNFRYANSSKSAITLNINSTGAKAIWINGAASSASNYTLPAGSYLAYYQDNKFYFRTDGFLPSLGFIDSTKTSYGEILPETGTEGQIFFQLSDGYTYELPAGGAVDEMLIKNSATDRDVKWTRNYVKRTGDTMTGSLTMLSRATTTAPSAATDRDWITLTPYFHTGGPWIIRNTDDSSASYLKIIYGNNTTFNMKHDGTLQLVKAYGAVWNDYAEFRETKEDIEPGRCIRELGDDTLELTTERLMRGCEIVSDTFGFAIGQSEKAKTSTAASGRVLAYLYEDKEEARQKIGWPVCSGPNGTVSIMTEEEEEKYPSRIIGTISAIPDYEIWYGGNNGDTPIQVNGRIWIRIR